MTTLHPFSIESLNQEYQNWLLHKPELLEGNEVFDTRPLEFLCDQIALRSLDDMDLLSSVKLLQQTLCWNPVGEEFVAQVELGVLAKELNRWSKFWIEKACDPESAIPIEKLISVGSSVFAADFLYPGDGNKIYEVDNVLHDLDANFLRNVSPVDVAQIYLERMISQKIAKKSP